MGELPRDGDQLLLEGLGLIALARDPWGGASPRALTKGFKSRILKAQAVKSASGCDGFVQGEFWATGQKGPFVYEGAPLLLEPRGK